MRSKRSQSAMEYLMTYGWAILIIAIALGALFQLGVFNGQNFAPKAPPGACQIFRPNGPGSTLDINLEGECQGELPKYVAQFNGGSVLIPNPSQNNGFPNGYTMTAWVVYVNPESECGYALGIEDSSALPRGGAVLSCSNSPKPYGETIDKNGYNVFAPLVGSQQTLAYGSWTFIAVSWNTTSQTISFYLNGAIEGAPQPDTISATNMIMQNTPYYVIGGQVGGGSWNGQEADAQLYNTSLSPADINTLYGGGIGGAPIDLQNLVGWWPLNGNFNDYSGNDNNGEANGGQVTFISNYAGPVT